MSATPNPATPSAFVSTPDDAPSYWQRDTLWTVLASADQTMGVFTLIEQLMPQGSGPGPHIHERMHEGFYILEGEIRFQLNDAVQVAGVGVSVWIPTGTPHAFRVTSDTARVLNYYTPGGFDDQVRYLGEPATERTLPPAGRVPDPRPEQQDAYTRRIADLHSQTWSSEPNLIADEGDERQGSDD